MSKRKKKNFKQTVNINEKGKNMKSENKENDRIRKSPKQNA